MSHGALAGRITQYTLRILFCHHIGCPIWNLTVCSFMQAGKPLVQGRALLNYKVMRFMKRQDVKLTAGSRMLWNGSSLSSMKLVRCCNISST